MAELTMASFLDSCIPEPMSGCWLWTKDMGSNGYGRIWLHGKKFSAHRAVWQLHHGEIAPGLCVLHRCDNPPCVNPGHLFLGTMADNLRDMSAKKRSANQKKTHCKRGHEFDRENTYLFRQRWGVGRACLACRALRTAALKSKPG